MINMPAIYIANGSAVLLLAIVLLSRKRNIRYGFLDEKLYGVMAWLNILLCVSETLSFCVDGVKGMLCHVLSVFFNSANFTLNIVLAFLWTVYVDYKLFEDADRLRKKLPILALPAAIVVLGSTVNLFTPVFFAVSAENVYSRAAGHFIPFAVSFLYLGCGALQTYIRKKDTKQYLFMPVLVFFTPITIASALQYAFYGISLMWLGVAIGLVSLYINVQNQTTYIDALSGVFNRQYLGHFLTSWSARHNADERLLGFMLDIDGFKAINDRYGHLSGDQVISGVGRYLRGTVGASGFIARYGGDEFIVLKRVGIQCDAEQCLLATVEKLNGFGAARLSPYDIRFSIGYGVFTAADTPDTFIDRLDTAMYAEKKRKIRDGEIDERRKGATA